jgi:hypothetical protein
MEFGARRISRPRAARFSIHPATTCDCPTDPGTVVRMAVSRGQTNWREVALLAGLAACIAVLWDTAALYPLPLLVVLFHELSHGAAAVLTGGRIVEIQMNPQEGGLCVTRGGSRFLVLSAGYVGSLLCGAVIVIMAARTRADKALTAVLGTILCLAAVLWVRPILGFGFTFAASSGIVLIAAARYLTHAANDVILKTVGLTSTLYAPLDIKSDIIDRPGLPSDAYMLAQYAGVPTLVWGATWFCLSLAIAAYLIRLACRAVPGPYPSQPDA